MKRVYSFHILFLWLFHNFYSIKRELGQLHFRFNCSFWFYSFKDVFFYLFLVKLWSKNINLLLIFNRDIILSYKRNHNYFRFSYNLFLIYFLGWYLYSIVFFGNSYVLLHYFRDDSFISLKYNFIRNNEVLMLIFESTYRFSFRVLKQIKIVNSQVIYHIIDIRH